MRDDEQHTARADSGSAEERRQRAAQLSRRQDEQRLIMGELQHAFEMLRGTRELRTGAP